MTNADQPILTRWHHLFTTDSPEDSEIRDFLNLVSPDLSMLHFSKIKAAGAQLITQFQPLGFSTAFGFEGYTWDDIINYLISPRHFGLGLKRERGKALLCGRAHAWLRQSFFNHLPRQVRIAKFQQTCQYYELLTYITEYLALTTPLQIADVTDIGMCHSVYACTIQMPDAHQRVLVVKSQSSVYQEFFSQLMNTLSWPGYRSRHIFHHQMDWEISDLVPGQNILDYLIDTPQLPDFLIRQLARHAALGDVLGRGDRHLENYVVSGDSLISVDITILFCEDNNTWTARYIAGGQYELNILHHELDSNRKAALKTLFFDIYLTTLYDLMHVKNQITGLIRTFFSEKSLPYDAYIQMVDQHLSDIPLFFTLNRKLYDTAWDESVKRLGYKQTLARLFAEHPETVNQHDRLKMYYLADKHRLTTFYLAEELPINIFELIDRLTQATT